MKVESLVGVDTRTTHRAQLRDTKKVLSNC